MTLFKPSSETGADVCDKILIYGPTHTGKTHAALSWPDPGLVDIENRGAHFADRYDFLHAQPHSMGELTEVLDEFKSGGIGVKTGVIDSYSVAFEKVKVRFTRQIVKDGKPSAIVDNVSVNRTIAPVREFIFSISSMNLIVIAHAQQKYDYRGDNNLSARKELEFLGDDKFRFAFDYIFRTELAGTDPRVHAVKFIVEKSASPSIKIGDVLLVRPGEKLYEVFRSRLTPRIGKPAQQSTPSAPTAGAAPANSSAYCTEDQQCRIEVLAQQLGLASSELATLVKNVTKRTPQYKQTTQPEAQKTIEVLEHRVAERLKGAA